MVSKVAKYFGYFAKKIHRQDHSKIAKSGHTAHYISKDYWSGGTLYGQHIVLQILCL